MPSNEIVVLLFTENRKAVLPTDSTIQKLQQEDRKPEFAQVMSKQIEAIDHDEAKIWVAMRVTPMMIESEIGKKVFGAFDAGRLWGKRDNKAILKIRWVAEGHNVAEVAETTAYFTKQVNETVASMSREKAQAPEQMRPLVDRVIRLLDSMTFKQDGKTMTGGMEVYARDGTLLPMLVQFRAAAHHAARVEAQGSQTTNVNGG